MWLISLSQEVTDMLRKYKITFVEVKTTRKPPKHHTEKLMARSKYDAKKRFYVKYPLCEIVKVEEVEQ